MWSDLKKKVEKKVEKLEKLYGQLPSEIDRPSLSSSSVSSEAKAVKKNSHCQGSKHNYLH